ncbi:hypothetical protein [Labedaea rhizosphaerae]|uniref:Antitoxin VbhA domain-containing protein n=1 Tax=Labedaea rhizosphaerae TaxID=598644 RepID=A0A4R6SLC5_LABRH|nr:hypothetical protein [Labedaea rhizosphaerae]TDQ05008.1 hypothetical protein EV186_101972 [Labedaea rhizosphaerae]
MASVDDVAAALLAKTGTITTRKLSYYSRQLSDPDTAVSHAAANAAIEGQELDDDWQETLRRIATGEASVDDVIAAEIRRIGPSA